ncbi:MAG TPA: hypothetical protein VNZ52_13995 [Candidatus Thermoplasmatota archaeon]|nr:hypothetical protein [Candidatus Thermoplasmatota archaeon]
MNSKLLTTLLAAGALVTMTLALAPTAAASHSSDTCIGNDPTAEVCMDNEWWTNHPYCIRIVVLGHSEPSMCIIV